MEPGEDIQSASRPGRIGRALGLMAFSVLAIGIAAVAYASPQLPIGSGRQAASRPAQAVTAQASTVACVDRSSGWMVADLPSRDLTDVQTTTAAPSSTRRLIGPGGYNGDYVEVVSSCTKFSSRPPTATR